MFKKEKPTVLHKPGLITAEPESFVKEKSKDKLTVEKKLLRNMLSNLSARQKS